MKNLENKTALNESVKTEAVKHVRGMFYDNQMLKIEVHEKFS